MQRTLEILGFEIKPKPKEIKMKTYKYDSRVAAIHSLRINYKSLAAEAAINRREMQKAGPLYRTNIAEHRRSYLRNEARYTHLALCYVRGIAYKAAEQTTRNPVNVTQLAKKIDKHWWHPARWRDDGPYKYTNTYVDNLPVKSLDAVKTWLGRIA